MTPLQINTALLGLHDKLLIYARSLTIDKDKAQDLIQETYLKALIYSDKFTDNTNFKAWVYTIMKNTFINHYRRNLKTRNAFDGPITDFHMNSQKDTCFQSPESMYSSEEIIKCINSLEDEYKVPFNMFIDGFKYREIAGCLDLPLGTVKSRIFFSRKKLEKSLKEYAY
jgi:RNA polymerase sigma-70 factor (ECF subfamily)